MRARSLGSPKTRWWTGSENPSLSAQLPSGHFWKITSEKTVVFKIPLWRAAIEISKRVGDCNPQPFEQEEMMIRPPAHPEAPEDPKVSNRGGSHTTSIYDLGFPNSTDDTPKYFFRTGDVKNYMHRNMRQKKILNIKTIRSHKPPNHPVLTHTIPFTPHIPIGNTTWKSGEKTC